MGMSSVLTPAATQAVPESNTSTGTRATGNGTVRLAHEVPMGGAAGQCGSQQVRLLRPAICLARSRARLRLRTLRGD